MYRDHRVCYTAPTMKYMQGLAWLSHLAFLKIESPFSFRLAVFICYMFNKNPEGSKIFNLMTALPVFLLKN